MWDVFLRELSWNTARADIWTVQSSRFQATFLLQQDNGLEGETGLVSVPIRSAPKMSHSGLGHGLLGVGEICGCVRKSSLPLQWEGGELKYASHRLLNG